MYLQGSGPDDPAREKGHRGDPGSLAVPFTQSGGHDTAHHAYCAEGKAGYLRRVQVGFCS